MIYVCVICMAKRPRLWPMEAEYRRLLEAIVSPFINTEELKASHRHWLLCTSCKLFMQTLYNFQQTALVGVKHLKCLLHKLDTQIIEDTTRRVTTIKIEPPVSIAAPNEELITVEAPTNGNPLTEEIDLKFERWPPESEHEPELQDCESDSPNCDPKTNGQNIQHPATISALNIQQLQIPKTDATAGSEGKFEVFTHKPQLSEDPRLPNIRLKDGVRKGPKKRIRKQPPRVACPHCGKCVLSSSLKMHTRTKHGDSPCKCDVCGKQCRNADVLKSHKNGHMKNTKSTDDPEAFCQQCALQFSSRAAYRVHLTTLKHIPRDQYQFECEMCQKTFLDEARLQRHIDVVHLGQRKHKCDQCDKSYGKASDLRHHVAVLHEKRPNLPKHVCHLCGKSFTVRKSLNEHLLSHEGLRPHQCPLCPATFTYQAALFTHNKLKHLKIKGKWKKKKKIAEKEGKSREEKADSND